MPRTDFFVNWHARRLMGSTSVAPCLPEPGSFCQIQCSFDSRHPRFVQAPGNLCGIAATVGDGRGVDGANRPQSDQEQFRRGDRFVFPAQAAMKIAGARFKQLYEALRTPQRIGVFQNSGEGCCG